MTAREIAAHIDRPLDRVKNAIVYLRPGLKPLKRTDKGLEFNPDDVRTIIERTLWVEKTYGKYRKAP